MTVEAIREKSLNPIMFHKTPNASGDMKSQQNRLYMAPELISNFNGRSALAPNPSRQQAQFDNFPCNNQKEENKSHHHRLRTNSNSNSLYQHHSQQANSVVRESQTNGNNINYSLNQRNSHNLTRSTTNPHLFQAPLGQHPGSVSSSQPASSPARHFALNGETNPICSSTSSGRHTITMNKQRSPASSSQMTAQSNGFSQNQIDSRRTTTSGQTTSQAASSSSRQDDRHERDSDEIATLIKEELEGTELDNFKELDLDTLGSLERNLPVELSFLIRQQAYCMARMNYLDRQIMELKESKLQSQAASTSVKNQTNNNRTNPAATSNTIHTKNGNFIPSDDSGGEYSRATISDDDELSSLLDQIAKSVRPERNQAGYNQHFSNQLPSRANNHYSVITNNHPHQPQQYAIINPNQLQHQAVPVFVMGSPIAMAHPSSISSNVLPGVHFQPEPRYNQYYEDFYVQNNSSSPTINRHNRSQQFDSSISAIEQLVSQKEKRQIKSQLKSADNWLKMRSSNLCNLSNNDNLNSANNNARSNRDDAGVGGRKTERGNLPASSASVTLANEDSNNVIEETTRSR